MSDEEVPESKFVWRGDELRPATAEERAKMSPLPPRADAVMDAAIARVRAVFGSSEDPSDASGPSKFTYAGDEFQSLTPEEVARLPPVRRLPIPDSLAGQALRDGAVLTIVLQPGDHVVLTRDVGRWPAGAIGKVTERTRYAVHVNFGLRPDDAIETPLDALRWLDGDAQLM